MLALCAFLLARRRAAVRLCGWHRIVPAKGKHLATDIAAAEFQIHWRAIAALRYAETFDGDNAVDLDALLAFVKRIVPWCDGSVCAVERAGREFDVVECG